MASEHTEQSAVSMSSEELRRTMRTLEPMYDMVRIVDPSLTQACTLTQEGELDMPHCCFDLLAKGRRCRNCISARTVASKHSVSKFEFVGDDAFYISTRYVEVDGKPRSIELVKRIDDTLLAPAETTEGDVVREALESDPNRRYLDASTGALNRRYLEDGVGALRGSKVAMLRALGLERVAASKGAKARDLMLSAIAGSIMGSIREVDTLVHFEDDTFVIIFEGMPQRLLPARLEQIREHVIRALAQQSTTEDAKVVIGAIVREGALDDLVLLAQDALHEADENTRPIVLVADESLEEADATLAPVPNASASRSVDALTGLLVPNVFRERLRTRIDGIAQNAETLRVVHLDIENFKAFNRAYGLPEGDLLLVQFASALREEFPFDLATRAGVDMFVVATNANDVRERIDRLRLRLASLRHDVALELKAGVFQVRDAALEAPVAMDRAKIACDSIKGKYDLSLRVFDKGLERQMGLNDHIVKSLDDAIAHGIIRPHYQAIVRSFTGRVCAMEALSRWEDPAHGIISPASLIPVLEQRHLIHKHDVHIVRCVCKDIRACMDAGLPVVPVSVNLSRLDFELCDIFAQVEAAVEEYGIPRELIGIEVTESTLDETNSFFRPQVERFRKAGYEIWMDDFGSGYSSLNLLKDYEFDVLKIDMAFLRGLEENHNSKKIIRSIVDMAKRIGIRTLAEGVETPSQYRFLKSIGCEMIQGYLFAKPEPFGSLSLGDGIEVEDPSDRSYLESIGRVNLLSQQPTEAVHPEGSDAASRGMPLAIVEWNGSSLRYFTTNEAYDAHLNQLGYRSVSEAESALNEMPGVAARFSEAVALLGESAGEQHVSYRFGTQDDQRSATMQFVARDSRNACAFLVSPQPKAV